MRKLLTIVIILLSFTSQAQRTFDTTFTGSSFTSGDLNTQTWNARVTLPAGFDPSGIDSFQIIIFIPGLGEMNTTAADVYKNGPHRYIIGGWNGGIPLPDRTIYPVIVSLQPRSSAHSRPNYMKPKIEAILTKYRAKRSNSVHFTGLSQGGWASTLYTGYLPTTSDSTWIRTVRSVCNVAGVNPTDQYGVEGTSPNRYFPYGNRGGQYLLIENSADGVGNWMGTFAGAQNGNKAGVATYINTTENGGGHNSWEWKYGGYGRTPSNYTLDGVYQNIYQWMVRQGDTVNAIGAGSGGANTPPVANAGADQTITLPVNNVTVNGSLSTDNISITGYAWTKVSGPATFTISSPSTVSTVITDLLQGVYVFRLTCTDGSGLTGTDDIQVTVNAAGNIPPTSNAGTDQTITLPTSSITLSGSGTDVDGTISSYSWVKMSGGSATIVTNFNATTSVTGLAEGSYSFRLTVTDNSGGTAFDDVTITVNPSGGVAAKYVNVNIYGGTNPYSNAAWNDWNVNASLTASNFNYSDASASTIDAVLSGGQAVSDNGAAYGGVIAPAEVLRYAFYSTTVRTLTIGGLDNGKTYNIELFGSRSTTGNTTRYTVNGNVINLTTDNNLTNSAKYSNVSPTATEIVVNITVASGTYNYINGFIITENGTGGSNASPTVNAGTDQTIDLPTNAVTVSATASDPDGVISTYQWSKAGGPNTYTIANANAASTAITGLVAGSYTFTVLVTDNLGATAADNVNINVTTNPINQAPIISAGSNQFLSTANTTTTINSNGSDDGSIVSYKISKIKVPSQRVFHVGVIGSSTFAGTGATVVDSSVIGRLKKLYQTDIAVIDTVYNLAANGLYVYEGAPTSYTPPGGRPTYAVGRNTTALITRSPKPDVAIISFPSNGYDTYTATEVCQVLQVMYNDLVANNIRTFITTTQPRPQFNTAGQAALQVLKDSIINRFGVANTLDFWSGMTNPGTDDMLSEYSFGDGIHFNNAGHERLYQTIIAKNILADSITSPAVISTPNASSSVISENPLGTSKYQVSVVDNRGLSATSFIDINVSTEQYIPHVKVYPGEYQVFFTDVDDKAFGMSVSQFAVGVGSASGSAVPPIALSVPLNTTFKDISSGLHHSLGCDNSGNVWTWGWNEQGQKGDGTSGAQVLTPYMILTDSLGNPFNNVIDVETYYSYNAYSGSIALKSDGTVWIWGNTRGGLRGNSLGGDNFRPVQITIPGGRFITKIRSGEVIIALANDGTVWSWGGNGNRTQNLGQTTWWTPAQVGGLGGVNVIEIAGAGQFSYALSDAGVLYGWGYYGCYLSIGTGGYSNNTPTATATNLTSTLGLPYPVWKVVTNTITTHVLLTDSTLWGWGDNATGSIGNGAGLDYSIYTENPSPYGGTIPKPYAWSLGPGQLLVQEPVQITAFHDWTEIYGGMSYVFYKYAQRLSGQLYSWGRNKTGVLGNGVVGPNSSIIADYPNSWDVNTATPVNPLGLTGQVIVTSPYCITNPTSSPCNTYGVPPPSNTPGRIPGRKLRGKSINGF